MKRHKSLYPLSHDHHHALVQARKLRLASSDPSIRSFYQAAEGFIAFWDSRLQPHFRQEEEILLPLLTKYSSADREEIIETFKQHHDIRWRFRELRDKVSEGTEPEAERLQELGSLLETHIRYEENELFPVLERLVPEQELWKMNQLIEEKKSEEDKA